MAVTIRSQCFRWPWGHLCFHGKSMRSTMELGIGKMCFPLMKRCEELTKKIQRMVETKFYLPFSWKFRTFNQSLTHNETDLSFQIFCIAGQMITVCKGSYYAATNCIWGKSVWGSLSRVQKVSTVLLSAKNFEAVHGRPTGEAKAKFREQEMCPY